MPPGIAVLLESAEAERRVAATPETVRKLIALGARVAVERGAGERAGIADGDYEQAGATVADRAGVLAGADIVLAVQAPDGSEAYTRRGDLEVTASGVLQTGDGYPVIGQNGPITVPPYNSLTVSPDGTVSIIPLGAGPDTQAQVIDRMKLADARVSQTVKGLDNLLRVKGGGALPQDMDATVQSGALEGSNVNMAQTLVDMIENQRSYEVQANLMKEAKSMDENSASLMRLPS